MSKLNAAPEAFTFDDFMLAPVHSEVMSRKDPDVSVDLPTLTTKIPVISSPMNTVTEEDMLCTMRNLGGTGVLHRYMDIGRQIKIASDLMTRGTIGEHGGFDDFFVAVGANGDLEERVSELLDAGVTRFCVDVANGHSAHCLSAVSLIKKLSSVAVVMAGNVCTYDGAYNLASVGADLIRVGIGPGSVCTTRLVTGHGVPQLTAIEDCAKIKWKSNGFGNGLVGSKFKDVVIVADGGIRSSGDAIKALAIGADAVMLGGMLSGTSDTPGDTHKNPDTGMLYKYYHGMASEAGRESWFERSKTAFVPEGESTKVPYKGDTSRVIEQFVAGLRVGMSYAGALSLTELRSNARWVKISGAGGIEGTPHGKR